jgi:hypothetical protein
VSSVAKNFEFIAELPASAKPWKMYRFDSGIVLINPDHPPMIARNGTIETLKFDPKELEAKVSWPRRIFGRG